MVVTCLYQAVFLQSYIYLIIFVSNMANKKKSHKVANIVKFFFVKIFKT